MFLVLAVGSGFLSLSLALLGIWLASDARRVRGRMEDLLSSPKVADPAVIDQAVDQALRRGLTRLLKPVATPIAALFPAAVRKQVRAKLASAGLLGHLGDDEFLLVRVIFVLLSIGAVVSTYRWLSLPNPVHVLAVRAIMGLVGVLLPDYWLQTRINQRQYRIRRTLPDALDLLVVSVEAGTGFDAAVARVEEKFSGPVAEEFSRVLQEMRLGKPRSAALRAMADRTAVPEVSVFVSAVCQADQLGVSMAQVLRVQAEALRQKRVYHIREVAQKIPIKMLFPLVFFIFPAMLVVIIGPGMIRIYETLMR